MINARAKPCRKIIISKNAGNVTGASKTPHESVTNLAVF